MNSVCFRIPGLRLPTRQSRRLVEPAELSALCSVFEGSQPILEQRLVQTPVMKGAAHLIWLWEVLSKTRTLPETAAFEWEADGGPAMSTQTWRLWSVHLTEKAGRLFCEAPARELDAAERDLLHDEVLACVRKYGFQLQQWADRWYLTCKDDWQVTVRPWCAQKHRPYTEESVEGPASDAFKALFEELRGIAAASPVNAERSRRGEETVDAFWPDGGSRRHLLKSSTLRAVMSEHSYVWGWAQNAGLLNFRTVAVSDHWPEAPEGDLVVELDDLYESYRCGNWQEWRSRLPALFARVNALANAAKQRRCQRFVLVAAGQYDTHTAIAESAGAAKGLLARFKKKKPLDWTALLKEEPENGEEV